MSIRIIDKCSWLCYFFNLNDTEWIIYKIWNVSLIFYESWSDWTPIVLGLHTKQKCMCGHYSYWMQCRLARSSRMDKHLADQDLFKINVGLGTIYEIMLTVRARFLLIGPINWPSVWSFIIPNICWNKFVLLFLDDFFYWPLFFYNRKRPV